MQNYNLIKKQFTYYFLSFLLNFNHFVIGVKIIHIFAGLFIKSLRSNKFFMNIYLGNLPYNINEDEIMELFEEYGSVSTVKLITDKFTGKSKGFGFVEMPGDDDAKKAIEELNGKEVKGRNITVNQAREKTDDDRGSSRGGGRNFRR